MELFMNNEYYIIVDGGHTLWCSRIDGTLTPRLNSDDLSSLKETSCLGVIYGIVGKFQVHPDCKRLIVIRQKALVGQLLDTHNIYKIQKIALLPLSQNEVPDLNFEICRKHHKHVRTEGQMVSLDPQPHRLQKTWNTIKTATTQVKPRKKEIKTREKFERRILDELLKLFTETDSFYYSLTADLTNSLQRQQTLKDALETENSPMWCQVDDRFFWNKHMLQELTESENPAAGHWILPMIQGFVYIQHCVINMSEEEDITPVNNNSSGFTELQSPDDEDKLQKTYNLILISRRSRFRAGTRYKRRGVDELGHCANYVETEQIIHYGSHIVSFVQVRGSIPVFWRQLGYKYRPPPQLDRGEEETQEAFAKHFNQELSIYNNAVVINLAEQTGKEKVVGDAYLNHILLYDSPDITYISFDFHEYCRGMKFENVSVLIASIEDIIKDMRYYWVDNHGLICNQTGTFRINCIDCLDRTNIVQTAIAKAVMDTQFLRLGLLRPEGKLPTSCRRAFQVMWANNGDIISRQYAGTAALKGDFTRTGERRIAGMMKDGYNSASRYYVNRFKDAYRQATIDLMTGNPVSDDILSLSSEREVEDAELEQTEQEQHERVKQLIEDCKKILIPETEVILGGWALVDADPTSGDPDQEDMDTILVLTKESYFAAEYDDETDRITKYQRVLLEDLVKIELGPEPSLFKSKYQCIRLHYLINGQSGYFHMFRSSKTRFFNNVAVPIKTEEDALESLKAICETFKVALSVKMLNVPFFEGRLERRKSKMPLAQGGSSEYRGGRQHGGLSTFYRELPSFSSMPRNISEGQLMSFVNVGSRALSNVTSQFAKLNPIRNVRVLGKRPGNGSSVQGTGPTIIDALQRQWQRPVFQMDSSEDDSEEDSLRRQKKQSNTSLGTYVSSDFSECSDLEEQDLLASESLDQEIEKQRQDSLLKSCGILATSPTLKTESIQPSKLQFIEDHFSSMEYHCNVDVDDFVLDAMRKASLRHLYRKESENSSFIQDSQEYSSSCQSLSSVTPQIQVSEDISKSLPSVQQDISVYKMSNEVASKSLSSVQQDISLCRMLSKSSDVIDNKMTNIASSTNEVSHLLLQPDISQNENTSKIKPSQSESAIQDFSLTPLNLQNPLSSPIFVKKDLVVSPLSRIAKGVQSLSISLMSGTRGPQKGCLDIEAYEKLKERKKMSQTRILEL
ncbi:phosphatidylinositide phosphatase SAC2-like [Limulus polyphemus]|uniref:Phosphatidylinositide phosphatase SAC2-like n=1 Tax=Limulus polyphemus TaxID=6850 RepID=A0ABM1SBT2_LIMPO|nr:phosphatidylinositide phosphatase SAC2-like [Limulus polyphemus]